jgi:hypothetical protein
MLDPRFVGVWRLVSCRAVRRNGATVDVYGRRPVGRLFYDADANMAVQIMKSGRPNFPGPGKFDGEAEAMRAAYEGYEAYCSTYSVEPEQGIIRHEVVSSLFPNWTGTTQKRYFEFQADGRLVLSTHPIGVRAPGESVVCLTWEKLSGGE